MGYDLKELVSHFDTTGEYMDATPYGEGHINNTYLVHTTQKNYILQRINHNVFHQPEQVMQNIQRVTDHLRGKIAARGGNPERETLTLIPVKEGGYFYKTEQGEYFRMYLFIEGARTYQTAEKPEHFYNAARAFGVFQNDLADFPSEELFETIPNFHNTPVRFDALERAAAENKAGRAAEVQAELQFAMARRAEAGQILDAIRSGDIPLRVTHNDTKFNNIMIDDATGDGLCVIDLDTVMPGSMLYDYGDSIRFGANLVEEDETDLSIVCLDLPLFEQYTRGFLSEMKNSITPGELKHMAFSAKLLTLECGVRFLTDYLEGDTYFKIHREKQNLDRTRTQFKLVADMEEKMEQMKQIVERYA